MYFCLCIYIYVYTSNECHVLIANLCCIQLLYVLYSMFFIVRGLPHDSQWGREHMFNPSRWNFHHPNHPCWIYSTWRCEYDKLLWMLAFLTATEWWRLQHCQWSLPPENTSDFSSADGDGLSSLTYEQDRSDESYSAFNGMTDPKNAWV